MVVFAVTTAEEADFAPVVDAAAAAPPVPLELAAAAMEEADFEAEAAEEEADFEAAEAAEAADAEAAEAKEDADAATKLRELNADEAPAPPVIIGSTTCVPEMLVVNPPEAEEGMRLLAEGLLVAAVLVLVLVLGA